MSTARERHSQKLTAKAETMTIKQLEDLLITFRDQKPILKQILARKKGEEYEEDESDQESSSDDEPDNYENKAFSYDEVARHVAKISIDSIQEIINTMESNLVYLHRIVDERQERKYKREEEAALQRARDMVAKKSAENRKAMEEKNKSEPVAKTTGTTMPIAKVQKIIGHYSLEQLQDFNVEEYEGLDYGVNVRGDTVDESGNFIGHWDGKTITRTEPPLDWEVIMGSYS